MKGTAQLSYNETARTIELVVPHGTRLEELANLREYVFGNLIGKLPRGCQACTSGDHFVIREELQEVIRVDLERLEVVSD